MKKDPIRDNYYSKLEKAEQRSDAVFYSAAVMSVATVFIDSKTYPTISTSAQVIFMLLVLIGFGLGQWVRLEVLPRAECARRKDFLSKVFGVRLTHELTDKYYTTNEAEPNRRMVSQVLENSLYSLRVVESMRSRTWGVVGFNVLTWIVLLALRRAELGLVVAVAQVAFSEQVVSKAIRLEALRRTFQNTFEAAKAWLHQPPIGPHSAAVAVSLFVEYECAKSLYTLKLDSNAFEHVQLEVDAEWSLIKQQFNL